jgi:YbbR domain-containing protein
MSVETAYRGAVSSDISVFSTNVRQDTTRTKKVEQTKGFTRIYEAETIIEYDTDKGIPSKVTTKEKITEQGNETKTDESEERGLSESDKNFWNHYLNAVRKTDIKEEVKEESVFGGMFKNLGKWIGIGLCAILFLWMVWNGIKKRLLL